MESVIERDNGDLRWLSSYHMKPRNLDSHFELMANNSAEAERKKEKGKIQKIRYN